MAEARTRGGEKSAAAKQPPRRRETLARRRVVSDESSQPRLPLGRRNWQILGAGLVVIVLGFIALARGSMTLAPFLLVGGYCVLLPAGLLVSSRKAGAEDSIPAAGE